MPPLRLLGKYESLTRQHQEQFMPALAQLQASINQTLHQLQQQERSLVGRLGSNPVQIRLKCCSSINSRGCTTVPIMPLSGRNRDRLTSPTPLMLLILPGYRIGWPKWVFQRIQFMQGTTLDPLIRQLLRLVFVSILCAWVRCAAIAVSV